MNMAELPLLQQVVVMLAALVLFLSFVLLAQARLVSAIHAFAWQGALIAAVTAVVALIQGTHHLYISALLTLVLKALLIPWMLHRLVRRLALERHRETIARPALATSGAVALVIFSWWLVLPIIADELAFTRNIIAVSLAVVLIGLLMMVSRAQAVAQVLGFMSMENGLFLAAVSATGGMPLVVELGVAFDVLVAMVLFGVFFLRISESIDSLDVDRLNRLREADAAADPSVGGAIGADDEVAPDLRVGRATDPGDGGASDPDRKHHIAVPPSRSTGKARP